jgi:hypothetical protein
MIPDIRHKSLVTHDDVIGLNFIRRSVPHVFRQYHKQGLRSHIMEVLNPDDVLKQNKGEVIDGTRFFPWADPLKMLRIFRTKFDSLEDALDEIRKLKIVETYLPPDSYAKSHEFIVDYIRNGTRDIILCGLQEYVDGEVLNPWDLADENLVADLFSRMKVERRNASEMTTEQQIKKLQINAGAFIDGAKKMIVETRHVPDFAGAANLLVTARGDIKLVDINNICEISFGPDIVLDDKGYPVCDKSIEAIWMLEKGLLDTPVDNTEPLYKIFLDPKRIKEVRYFEEKFHSSLTLNASDEMQPQGGRP